MLYILFSAWNCRDYDPMLSLLNVWTPVLAQWITDNIRDQLILPRLQVSLPGLLEPCIGEGGGWGNLNVPYFLA